MTHHATLGPLALLVASLAALPGAGSAQSQGSATQPVVMPRDFRAAIDAGTRTEAGAPGPAYWQQWTTYRLTASVDPNEKRLNGGASITYHNRSPYVLPDLYLHLHQNLHAEGAIRNEPQEITGGVRLDRVTVSGVALEEGAPTAGYDVRNTILRLSLPRPLAPHDSIAIEIDWHFTIPASGAGRMGWSRDNFLFLAYWYPQMAVFDDVVGWQIDPYLGGAEFYAGFGEYTLSIEAPTQWLVRATGAQTNAAEVLPDQVLERLALAARSDTVVHVVTRDDFRQDATTRDSESGTLTWTFHADSVRDVAFSVTYESLWDAVRTPVGDRDGDGDIDYTRIDALYRPSAPRWRSVARYERHAIRFLSEYTAIPYPWPHMTAVEGAGIITGGMEYPMMTLIGSYNQSSDDALYYVTAHELAHMWIPMIVGTDERRYAWMDEGSTTFHENMARTDFFASSDPSVDQTAPDRETYIRFALSQTEGEIMRWTDYQYPGAGGIASYQKPATVLVALKKILGEEMFIAAWHRYLADWRYKHPKPWDFFNTIETVSGRDLDWFWSAWYFETWTLDQAVTGVSTTDDETTVRIANLGRVPMPVYLTITLADGQTEQREITVDRWLDGTSEIEATWTFRSAPIRIEIDAEAILPDVNRDNNVWVAMGD